MRILFLIIALLASYNVEAQLKELNKKIYDVQRKQGKITPFESFGGDIKKQKEYRHEILKNEDEQRAGLLENDTIYLIESYDFTYINCPSDQVYFIKDTLLITYTRDWSDSKEWKYTRKEVVLSRNLTNNSGFQYEDVVEIRELVRKSEEWNKDPLRFGNDDCFDGSHTHYTVIYPDLNVEGMYMRCCVPKRLRE